MGGPRSGIVLTERFDETIESFRREWPDALFFRIDADEFLVEHAREAVEKAYLTSEKEKVIVLSARHFTPIAQNKLLKILEEPPPKTHFLLLTPSRSGLLPTVRSRLVIEDRSEAKERPASGLEVERFDLAELFAFLQERRRIDAKTAAETVESLAKEVLRSGRFRVDEDLLEAFSQSVRLLDMGSPPNFVLTRLGVKLLEKRR